MSDSSYQPDYVYKNELHENDPRAEQPNNILTVLKPHQLTGLHRSIVMEKEGSYFIQQRSDLPKTQVTTNVGILGDIVGYGKTLLALALIAATPVESLLENNDDRRFFQSAYSHFLASAEVHETHPLIMSTLLVVPHGPVFEQWKTALEKETKLKFLAIGLKKDLDKHFPSPVESLSDIYNKLGEYDVVLIKTTMMRNLHDHYVPYTFAHPGEKNPMHYWARVMFDEAHDSLDRIPWMKYRFLWLISGTYNLVGSRDYASPYLGNSTFWIKHERNTILVRSNAGYVKQSFSVPDYSEITHRCIEPYGLRRIRHILHADIARMIDANDFVSAMRVMGIQEHNSSSIIEHITHNVQRDLCNKRKELCFVEELDIPAEERTKKKEILQKDIDKLEQKNLSLQEQFQKLESDQCSVCYETFKDLENVVPMVLPCNHVFCQSCIYRWYMVDGHHTCPICRADFLWANVVSVALPSSKINPDVPKRFTKEQKLVEIIQAKPDGKFLIFSSYDHSFQGIIRVLAHAGIEFSELKGTTYSMVKTLQNFKDGNIQCILLNTYNTGSGIDISCATDVILLHSMGKIRQQAIGRAQRVGRTTPLVVHNLLHDQEELI